MAGKKGTLVGRTLLKFIPEASVFHTVAEAADLSLEALVFDKDDKTNGAPVKELPEVKEALRGLAALLKFGMEKGIFALNFPIVDGEEEVAAKEGALKLLGAYVDEMVD